MGVGEGSIFDCNNHVYSILKPSNPHFRCASLIVESRTPNPWANKQQLNRKEKHQSILQCSQHTLPQPHAQSNRREFSPSPVRFWGIAHSPQISPPPTPPTQPQPSPNPPPPPQPPSTPNLSPSFNPPTPPTHRLTREGRPASVASSEAPAAEGAGPAAGSARRRGVQPLGPTKKEPNTGRFGAAGLCSFFSIFSAETKAGVCFCCFFLCLG